MSSKPPKPNQNSSSTQFQQPLLNYPSLYVNSDDLHLPSTHAAAEPDNTFYRRNSHGKGFELDEHAGAFMLTKLGAAASDHVAASHDQEQGRSGIGFTERFKRWSFENERGGGTVQGNNMQSYSMSPLLEITGAQNDHSLLSSAAAGAGAGGGRAGGGGSSEIREGGHGNLVQGSLGSSVGESINVGYLPLSNLETEFANTKPQYSTQDMEILRVTQGHNPSSGSVQQQQQQQLYEQQIPSSLTPHNLASYLNFTTHRSPTSYPTNDHLRLQHNQHLQLLGDHHQWGTGLHTTSSSSHPHAELLLLPGVAESVVEASPTSPHTAAFSSSKLDLLHGSSLHDKQAHMLGPVGAVAGGGGRMPAAAQMWHIDKLDMAVGLGLRDHSAQSSMFAQEVDHFASTRQAQSGLSLFLQSPQDRAQTGLSLDAARYSSRSASGSLGVLRNSKYLKAAQQLLNEFCNVCRDAIPDVKSSIAAASISQHIWNATGVAAAEENIAGNRAFLSSTEKDMNLYSHADHYKLGSSTDHCSSQHLKLSDNHDHHQQEQPPADHGSAGSPPCASLDNPPPPPPPHKQLPADERCHLQMRKARLIAMVEELDRRYQQYRDQMQLIVTSFESATGMGAAAAYTTLWRKGMSRQFRGLRDTIGEHIRKVCRLLGEEVSSVPILSRGETPRLRLVDQRLRHQRSLQQIGMLPQQQAWRPQRGLPERSVSVLRAWLFEHFLHPYPKDSEKSMLARLTGLSRNQVSNWFINARVRLWKPMIEEMYVEESKALELSEAEASTAGEVTRSAATAAEGGSISSDHSSRERWQATAAPAPAAAHYASASANLYDTRQQHRSDDFSNFIHFHGGASRANDQHIAAATDMQGQADVSSQAQYSWMKSMQAQAQAQAQAQGDIGVLTHSSHDHMSLQAAALMAQGQLNASSSFMKNGVSLTLGLQQPPPHSGYNTSSSAYARPSEALLF